MEDALEEYAKTAVVPVLPGHGGRARGVRKDRRSARVQVPRGRGARLRAGEAQHGELPDRELRQGGRERGQVRQRGAVGGGLRQVREVLREGNGVERWFRV